MVERDPKAGGAAPDEGAGLSRTREFFSARADTWDERFPDDEPAFAAAVAAMELAPGAVVLDVGCGTGRAVAPLRDVVGPSGTVVALDATPEMLRAAVHAGRAIDSAFVLADAAFLPLRAGSLDGVFAAGLLTHLASPRDGLRGFAAVTRVGGALALFHPIGRAVLAARHGHELRTDDIRAPGNLEPALAATGWQLVDIDDGEDCYLAVARRTGAIPTSTDARQP